MADVLFIFFHIVQPFFILPSICDVVCTSEGFRASLLIWEFMMLHDVHILLMLSVKYVVCKVMVLLVYS